MQLWSFKSVPEISLPPIEKTPRKFQFGKKSTEVYHFLYSSTEQLQVALWTYMFLKLGLNNEKSLTTLPLQFFPLLSFLL